MGKRKKAAGKTGKKQGSNKGRSGKAKAKPKKLSNRKARAAKIPPRTRLAAEKAVAAKKKPALPKRRRVKPPSIEQLVPGGAPLFVTPLDKV